jgi:hypothetical protein
MTPMEARRYAGTFPVSVSLYRSWADHDGIHVGFQTEAEARSLLAARPEPLADLVIRGRGVIAARRMVAHPAQDPATFTPRDPFPWGPDR